MAQAPVGVRSAAGQLDAPATELDEEQDVEALQRDRLDAEEIDREHALRLLAQKRPPGQPLTATNRTLPAWRRIFLTVVAETRRPSPLISPAIR